MIDPDQYRSSEACTEYFYQHLNRLSEQYEITVLQDIRSQAGMLLQTAGRSWVRLLEPPGDMPLISTTDQVTIDGCLAEADLVGLIERYLASNPELEEIHQGNQFQPVLDELRAACFLPHGLKLQLTVMQHRLPAFFEHSLFCAWGCGLIGRQLGLAGARLSELFFCGLCHDIGLLYVPPQALESSVPRSLRLWQQFQTHAEIGAQLLSRYECFSLEVSRGIQEHHERLDRTGYPTRKPAAELGLFGQVISATDVLHKIKTRQLAGKGRPLNACLPYLKSNQGAFPDPVYHALFTVLAKTEVRMGGLVSEPDGVVAARSSEMGVPSTEQRNRRELSVWVRQLMPYVTELQSSEFRHLECDESRKVLALSQQIQQSVRHCVALEGSPFSYSQQGGSGEGLQECRRYELLWLFKRFEWALERLLGTLRITASKSQRHDLELTLGSYRQILRGVWAYYGLDDSFEKTG